MSVGLSTVCMLYRHVGLCLIAQAACCAAVLETLVRFATPNKFQSHGLVAAVVVSQKQQHDPSTHGQQHHRYGT